MENAIVAPSGLHTMEYKRGNTDQRNAIMLERYKAIVRTFNPNNLKASDIGLKDIMMDRLKHAQGPVMGEKLWNKFNRIRKELRIMHTKIKTSPREIPSRMQLSQIYREWIAQQYKENKAGNLFCYIFVNKILIHIFQFECCRLPNLMMFL